MLDLLGSDNFSEETTTMTPDTNSGLVDSNNLKAHAEASSRNASNTNLSFQANAGASNQYNAITDFSGFQDKATND